MQLIKLKEKTPGKKISTDQKLGEEGRTVAETIEGDTASDIEAAVDRSLSAKKKGIDNLRTRLGIEKGGNIYNKVVDSVKKVFGAKLPEVSNKNFKEALKKDFNTLLFKDIKNDIGTRAKYKEFIEGDITFKTVPDYENSLDSDNNSRYEIDVRVHSTAYPVSENPNLYISEGITIEVTNVKEWPSSAQVDFIDDTYTYGWVDFIPANFNLAKIIAITSDIPYTKVIISGQDADYFNFQNGTKEGTETNDLSFLIYRNNDNYECGRSFSFRITLTDGTNSVYDDAIIPLTCS